MTPPTLQEAARKACRCGGCRQDEIGQDVLPCAVRDRIASAIERAVAEERERLARAVDALPGFEVNRLDDMLQQDPHGPLVHRGDVDALIRQGPTE